MNEIKIIKEKFNKIQNPNLHLTKDKKINTIHDINKFVNSKILNKLSKNKKLTNIIKHILNREIVVRNFEFFKTKKNW